VISPGRILEPPPTNPACEIVWCGAQNGRRRISGWSPGSMLLTE
jgi:hypothetical protein